MIAIHVYGKHGCAKCALLKKRIVAVLLEPKYNGIVKVYHDILNEDCLVRFCKQKVLNPTKIPAFIVEDDNGPIPAHEKQVKELAKSDLFGLFGVQTDYSDDGKGVIITEMIRAAIDGAIDCNRL